MIDFEPGKVFLVAVQQRQKLGDVIKVRGLQGRIVEEIPHADYLEVWAFRGFPSEAISLHPKYYYRCEKLAPERRYPPDQHESLADTVRPVQDSQCAGEV